MATWFGANILLIGALATPKKRATEKKETHNGSGPTDLIGN